MDIDTALEAYASFSHACEPGVGTLDNPAMTAKSVVALDPFACDARDDAALLLATSRLARPDHPAAATVKTVE